MAESNGRARPRIGVTKGIGKVDEYVAAVTYAGGEPIVLTADPARLGADLATLDGLLMTGGEDVDPRFYGATPHPETHVCTPPRDDYELALVQAAIDARVPTLAICRGIQVANVALGGSLLQHVPDVVGEAIPHRRETSPGQSFRGLFPEHVVTVHGDSRLHEIVGTAFTTSSRHHQALDRVASRLQVVAHTGDGIVEAVELVDADWFWVAVQWHPESTVELDGGQSRALFRALVDASAAAR